MGSNLSADFFQQVENNDQRLLQLFPPKLVQTECVRAGITSKEKRSIADVLVDPETNIRYFDILTGKTDREEEALLVRANNRTYRSRGIQTRAEYRFT